MDALDMRSAPKHQTMVACAKECVGGSFRRDCLCCCPKEQGVIVLSEMGKPSVDNDHNF